MAYTIGLDYGTNSVRALIVDVANGNELATAVHEYETGEAGIILDSADHNLARQNPNDYLKGAEAVVKEAIAGAKKADKDFKVSDIIGIGIDTTGSTPIPVDKNGTPLSMLDKFKDNPNACAWSGKTIPAMLKPLRLPNWLKKNTLNILPNAAGHIHPNGFSAKYFIV